MIVLLLGHTLLHVKYIDLPPVGFHQWRQTQTLSVARNYYEEGMNILQPRVDNRGDTPELLELNSRRQLFYRSRLQSSRPSRICGENCSFIIQFPSHRGVLPFHQGTL